MFFIASLLLSTIVSLFQLKKPDQDQPTRWQRLKPYIIGLMILTGTLVQIITPKPVTPTPEILPITKTIPLPVHDTVTITKYTNTKAQVTFNIAAQPEYKIKLVDSCIKYNFDISVSNNVVATIYLQPHLFFKHGSALTPIALDKREMPPFDVDNSHPHIAFYSLYGPFKDDSTYIYMKVNISANGKKQKVLKRYFFLNTRTLSFRDVLSDELDFLNSYLKKNNIH